VKESRKIAEGLPNEVVKAETVIILDSEGMQCPSLSLINKRLSWSFLCEPTFCLSASLTLFVRVAFFLPFIKPIFSAAHH
jgi:hypothetical protein